MEEFQFRQLLRRLCSCYGLNVSPPSPYPLPQLLLSGWQFRPMDDLSPKTKLLGSPASAGINGSNAMLLLLVVVLPVDPAAKKPAFVGVGTTLAAPLLLIATLVGRSNLLLYIPPPLQ